MESPTLFKRGRFSYLRPLAEHETKPGVWWIGKTLAIWEAISYRNSHGLIKAESVESRKLMVRAQLGRDSLKSSIPHRLR